jgi:hypothetical protein
MPIGLQSLASRPIYHGAAPESNVVNLASHAFHSPSKDFILRSSKANPKLRDN